MWVSFKSFFPSLQRGIARMVNRRSSAFDERQQLCFVQSDLLRRRLEPSGPWTCFQSPPATVDESAERVGHQQVAVKSYAQEIEGVSAGLRL